MVHAKIGADIMRVFEKKQFNAEHRVLEIDSFNPFADFVSKIESSPLQRQRLLKEAAESKAALSKTWAKVAPFVDEVCFFQIIQFYAT